MNSAHKSVIEKYLDGREIYTLEKEDMKYLGPAKFRILQKLQNAGFPLTYSEVSGQEALQEMRDWSKQIFRILDRVPRNVAEAKRLGFSVSFEGHLYLSPLGSTLRTVGILERELAYGITNSLYATVQGRLRWSNLRKPSRADRKYL